MRLGWPDVRGPDILLDYLRRDLNEGIRRGRFRRMPIALALNIVAGAVLGATHCMLDPDCAADFAEQTAAAALRALGLDAKTAEKLARRPLQKAQQPVGSVRPDNGSIAAWTEARQETEVDTIGGPESAFRPCCHS